MEIPAPPQAGGCPWVPRKKPRASLLGHLGGLELGSGPVPGKEGPARVCTEPPGSQSWAPGPSAGGKEEDGSPSLFFTHLPLFMFPDDKQPVFVRQTEKVQKAHEGENNRCF